MPNGLREAVAVSTMLVSLPLIGALYSCREDAVEPPSATSGGENAGDESNYTLADVVNLCRAIQESERIPAQCAVDYVDGVPTMMIAFREERDVAIYGEAIAERVALPFCAVANASRRRAQLLMAVGRQARKFECEIGQWSEPVVIGDDAQATLEQVVGQCEAIQRARDVPVGCGIGEIDGTLALIMKVGDVDQAEQYLPAIGQLAGPFCNAVNERGGSGAVVVALGDGHARGMRCDTGQWSPWTHVPELSDSTPIERAVLACEAIQRSDAPVGCELGEVRGTSSLLLSFRNHAEADALLGPAARLVATPFCTAAVQVRQPASVLILVGDKRARRFSCEQGVWSEWIELSNPPAQRRRALPRSTPRRAGQDPIFTTRVAAHGGP